jgi:hypothetical protein
MVLSVVGTGTTALIVVIALLDSTRVYRLSGPWPWISP